MRAQERKLRTVLESKKNERLSKNRIAEIISEVSTKTETVNRPSIDGITLSLLRRTDGVTIEEIVNTVLGEYPEKDRDVLFATTKRRLGGYLKNKTGENIVSRTDESGTKFYRIPSDSEVEKEGAKEVETGVILIP